MSALMFELSINVATLKKSSKTCTPKPGAAIGFMDWDLETTL